MKAVTKLEIPDEKLDAAVYLAKHGNYIGLQDYMKEQLQLAYTVGVEAGLLEALAKLRKELGE